MLSFDQVRNSPEFSVPPLLHFRYLGGRDYIDIAQITREFFQARSICADPYEMRDFSIRMRRPLRTHSWLLEGRADGSSRSVDCAASISCFERGTQRYWDLVPSPDEIRERAPDPDSWEDARIQVEAGECRLLAPLGDFSTKTLMLMGKAVLQRNSLSESPRVAGFRFARPPLVAEIPGLRMRIARLARGKFAVLAASVGDFPVGNVWVRL